MARAHTPEEKVMYIREIIYMTRLFGRLTVSDAATRLGMHRSTVEKYFREAVASGEVVRHGHCGLFPDVNATIKFDMKRFSHKSAPATNHGAGLPAFSTSQVMRRVFAVYGVTA